MIVQMRRQKTQLELSLSLVNAYSGRSDALSAQDARDLAAFREESAAREIQKKIRRRKSAAEQAVSPGTYGVELLADMRMKLTEALKPMTLEMLLQQGAARTLQRRMRHRLDPGSRPIPTSHADAGSHIDPARASSSCALLA